MAAWHQSIRLTRGISVPSLFGVAPRRICLPEPPTSLGHHIQTMADLASCVTPLLERHPGSTGILNLLSITYAFRPQLRIRLTLGGRTFPRKPWDYGGRDFHPAFRYSCPHNHFHAINARFPSRFASHGTLLYHFITPKRDEIRSVGSRFSPDHFRRRITRLVSCYALFKWWLPLSQHPRCLRNLTSLVT